MRYLVTGGAGFIGSHIAEALVARGEEVRVVDSFVTGRRENLAGFREHIELVEGDLADPAVAARAVEGVERVLHQAAVPSVPRSVAEPVACHRNAVGATLALLEAARRAGVARVVLASSSSIYGDRPGLPRREGQRPDPRSPYAAAKLACELLAGLYARQWGLSTVCLRYFNVFGPRQNPRSKYAAVIPLFIRAALEGRPPLVYGDGRQARDFTYVSNVVEANLLAVASEAPLAGEIVNVACGRKFTLLDLLDAIREITGRSVEPRFAPPQPGDVRESLADVARASELFGYEPRIDFREGLARTVESLASG